MMKAAEEIVPLPGVKTEALRGIEMKMLENCQILRWKNLAKSRQRTKC